MNLKTLTQIFQDNKCSIKYDGSLSIDNSSPFSTSFYTAYLESLYALEKGIPFNFANDKIEYASIKYTGITVEVELKTDKLQELENICIKNKWKYEFISSPIDGALEGIERTFLIYPHIGPIILKVTSYSM